MHTNAPLAYNPTMAADAFPSTPNPARRVLAVLLVVGMVLALFAAAFAPALSGSAFLVRVGAGVVGVGCVVGLVLWGRPRGSVGAAGARPICPQCGYDLTDVRAEVSGRTTCPACEMSWAFGRDRAAWRAEAPARRVGSPGVDADGPIPFPGSGRAKRSGRRGRSRAIVVWVAVPSEDLFAAGPGAPGLVVAQGIAMKPMGRWRAVV